MPPRRDDNERARLLVAQEAARIIVNSAVRDYAAAKLKAAEKLGLTRRAALPGNGEIEAAVADYLALFGRERHVGGLRELRGIAVEAMRLLDAFSPRLVGPVLAGTADDNSAVNLHVFADPAERVSAALDAQGIRSREYQRRLRFRRQSGRNSRRDSGHDYPGVEFLLDDTPVQATIFPVDGIRQAPLSPVDGRPMKRAAIEAVRQLIETT